MSHENIPNPFDYLKRLFKLQADSVKKITELEFQAALQKKLYESLETLKLNLQQHGGSNAR